MSDVLDLIRKIGEIENSIEDRAFVSPIFFNEFVATRIHGIVYKFKILHVPQPGWYDIKPVDKKTAKTKKIAELSDIENYLKHLQKIRLVLVMKKNNVYFAIPDKSNSQKFSIDQLIPVYLFDDTVLDFDRIIARFDGANFWFHQIDSSNDPSKSTYLREQLLKFSDPKKIGFTGLTLEEKIAYSFRFSLDKKLVIDSKKETLRNDVLHAGGDFISFIEKKDHYSVTYFVDGHKYTSNVSKDERRSVITAGICLSGEDRTFDLKSLITVMREGQQEGRIHRTHNV
jgi:hypothetical protein